MDIELPELPHAFPNFLLVASIVLFYLAYVYGDDVFLKYFGIVFGVCLVFVALITWIWDRSQYHEHISRSV